MSIDNEQVEAIVSTEPEAKPQPPKKLNDDAPIEIPEPVPKPNEKAFQQRTEELGKKIEQMKNERSNIFDTIQKEFDSSKDTHARAKEARDRLNQIREEQKLLSQQRKALLDKKASILESGKSTGSRNKEIREKIKFRDTKEVDDRIAQLEYEQSSRSLSLQEEKRIVKEISELKKSRDLVMELQENDRIIKANRESRKEQLDALNAQIDAVTTELKAVRERVDAQFVVVRTFGGQIDEARKDIPALKARRDKLKEDMDATYKELQGLKREHREAMKKYKDYEFAVRRAKAQARRAEAEARKAAYTAQRKAEEEANKPAHPKAREIVLCNVMENYLRGVIGLPAIEFEDPDTIVTGQASTDPRLNANIKLSNGSDTSAAAKVDASTLGAGRAVGKMSADANDDPYAALLGGGSKKRNKDKKKRNAKSGAPEDKLLKHSVEVATSMELLEVPLPNKVSEVQPTIEAIQSKRKSYEEQMPEQNKDEQSKDSEQNDDDTQNLEEGEIAE